MKTAKLRKKLSLNKETISKLNPSKLDNLNGVIAGREAPLTPTCTYTFHIECTENYQCTFPCP